MVMIFSSEKMGSFPSDAMPDAIRINYSEVKRSPKIKSKSKPASPQPEGNLGSRDDVASNQALSVLSYNESVAMFQCGSSSEGVSISKCDGTLFSFA